jgi:hypothetical protein
MPNRRAFRPDSKYYRTTRRQSLGRGGFGGGGGSRAPGIGIPLAMAAVAALLFFWGWHGGTWAHILGYGGGVFWAAAAVVLFLATRR